MHYHLVGTLWQLFLIFQLIGYILDWILTSIGDDFLNHFRLNLHGMLDGFKMFYYFLILINISEMLKFYPFI